MTQGAAAVAEEYAGSISALDYLVLNTGAYWGENGALSLSDELLDAIETLQGKTALWCTVNPQGALIREGTAGQSIDTPQERQVLAQEIAAFAEQYGLAGIDIDWEFPLDDEWEDFSTFLITLKDTLSRNSKPVALSLALHPEKIALSEVVEGIRSGAVAEVFACGPAAVVTPLTRLAGDDFDVEIEVGEKTREIHKRLTDSQWGRAEDPYGWTYRLV